MSPRICSLPLALALIAVSLTPAIARAQEIRQPSPLRRALLLAGPFQSPGSMNRSTPAPTFAFAVSSPPAAMAREQAGQQAPASKRSAMGWAIAAGIAGGIGVSAIAASKYGENETGRFCTRCFMQWSAVSIPVGAGIGAGVGLLIDRARR